MVKGRSSDSKKGGASPKKVIRKVALKPSAKSVARFAIKSFQTKCPEVVVSVCSRMSDHNVAAFIKPMVDSYARDIEVGGPTPSSFDVQYICSRKGSSGNTARKVSPDANYEWEALITLVDDEAVTAKDVGENLAEKFSSFESEKYESQGFQYVAPSEAECGKPLNHYLLDWDCVVLLRHVYSEASKYDLLNDIDIIEMFFGSKSVGEQVLMNISDFKWNSIL